MREHVKNGTAYRTKNCLLRITVMENIYRVSMKMLLGKNHPVVSDTQKFLENNRPFLLA